MSAHLAVLQVVVPLLAAPFCLLSRNAMAAWLIALAATGAASAISVALLLQVIAEGTLSYAIGGWAPPIGIEYRIDVASALMLVLISGTGAVVAVYARRSVLREVRADRIYLFYCMYLLCCAGLLGMAATGDVFNLFVFLEISSLSSYVLIAMGRERQGLTAAYRYLIMGTIGATFYIIGVGLLYAATGTLNMADLAQRVGEIGLNRTVLTALAFLTVGLSLKFALFPLHQWLPNAYAFAPSAVSAFLAATATKVALYALLRIDFTVLGSLDVLENLPVRQFLLVLAIAAILVASLAAVFEQNVKRMMAFSSIAQIGYIVLGIGISTIAGLTAGLVHLFNHALMKGAIFMALGCVAYRLGSVRLADLEGLGRTMPLTAAALVVGGLSLIGVPATVGFVSKWTLVQASLEIGWWPLAVLVLASSLISAVYVWRVVEAMYFRPPAAARRAEAPVSMVVPMWIFAGAAILFGLDATATLGVARRAALVLLGVSP